MRPSISERDRAPWNRTRSLCLLSALLGLAAACGRVVVDPIDRGGVSGEGGANGGGGAAATTGGAGGEPTDGGGMCNLPAPPSPTLPDQPGCYFNMGDGWLSVPCLCDLWLANTTQAPITVGIQLVVTPPEQVPTLTGPLDVEIAFDDPEASLYAIWTKQGGNGELFAVTSEGGTTTVRMGAGSVALAPVPIAACKTRTAIALVLGSNSAALSMQAVLDSGIAFATTEGTCSSPPPF
jgi:hypothetical protein